MTEQTLDAALPIEGTVITGYSIRQPARVEYKPQPDITAYDVARLLPILLGFQHMMYPEDHIPDDLMRHFKIWRPA
ncbi:hypothetical protein [Sphingobium sp.]|uniref:hypothetical protein n=1 Tax=Sphingobium sp. TaxID=1912891 RepID=UPI0035C69F5E